MVVDSKNRCIRYVHDIGLWAFSRGRTTCRWRTAWCTRNCYNNKFYRLNSRLVSVDVKDNVYWRGTRAKQFAADMPADITRFRFAVRGEIWLNYRDVMKVRNILLAKPEVTFWIPTRAWQSQTMAEHIDELIRKLPNARVMASTDPTVSDCTEQALARLGWSTVFSGDNDVSGQMRLIGNSGLTARPLPSKTTGKVRCPKTWRHALGHCAVCNVGCFSDRRVDVHLRQHR